MRQTESYKLNLIDTSDTFSPDALNENAEALEAQLARVDAALATIPKIAYGTYTGNSATSRKISLPFTPKVVYVGANEGHTFYYYGTTYYVGGLALTGNPAVSGSSKLAEIVDGGFQVFHYARDFGTNYNGTSYRYFAIG